MFTHYQKISRLLGNIAAVVLLTIASFGFASFAYAASTTLPYTGDPINTWTVPQNVTSLTVSLTAGGGGGAGGAYTYGGGGGGAGSSISRIIPVTPGQIISYVVGKGGNGGPSGSYAVSGSSINGGDGTYTTFSFGTTTITVLGGKGGAGAVVGGGGGQGGLAGGIGGTNGGNGDSLNGQRNYGGNGGSTPMGFGGVGGFGNTNTYTLPTAGTNGNGGGAGSGWASGDGTLRDSGRNGGNGLITVSYTPVPSVLTNLTISPLSPTILVGATTTFTASTTDQFLQPFTATTTWSSSSSTIGTINPVTGLFTAISNGTTTVTATAGTLSTSTVVTVSNLPSVISAINLAPINPTIVVGSTLSFTASTTDQYGNPFGSPVMQWYSFNPSVGNINQNTGLFTASSLGTATVMVMAIPSGLTATTTVTVVNPAPILASISIAPLSPTISIGQTVSFTASTTDQFGQPFTATTTWTSSSSTVGTINLATGVFNGLSLGTTTVTATAGALSTSTIVTVSNIVIPPVATVLVTNSTVEGTYYLSYATTSGAIPSLTGTTTIANSTSTNSTVNNSSIATSTIASAHLDDVNLNVSSVSNSTLTNDDITRCTILDSSVTNYFATDCYIAFSVLDPTPLYHFISSTSTGSQIYASDIYNSVINNSYVATSTLNAANISNSTTTNSIIATSTIANHSNVDNSTITLSNINNSTISSSTIASSTITDSVISSSTLTNVVSASSTITNTTLSNASTTNAVIDNGIIYSGTITIGGNTYVITTPTLISSLGATSIALVNLGTAANYVILAKTAITTTGVTSITGDLGISPAFSTAMTGFALALDGSGTFSTSSLVNGKIYAADYSSLTPANLTAAVSAMQAAYTDANSRATTVLDAGACITGTCDLAGTTLVGGVYTFDGPGNVTITNNMTLSGSASDVWIFQIPGTLNISANKKIILTGGAQASHVFFAVAGTTTIKPGATFSGVILAGPGASTIAMQNGAILNGRALGQTDVTLIGNTITVSTSTPDTTAPVITITGSNPANVTLGQTYIDAGATALDNIDGDVTSRIASTSNVNTSATGTYAVTYTVSDLSGNATSSSRTVNVTAATTSLGFPWVIVGSAPFTVGTPVFFYMTAGGDLQLYTSGYVFVADLGSACTVSTPCGYTFTTPGTYELVEHTTWGISGTFDVVAASTTDTVPPVITLNGSSTINMTVGGTYTELGASAFDAFDATGTAVSITGTVITSTAGTYTITYTSSDAAGNIATKTRTVIVSSGGGTPDTTAPVITILGSLTVNMTVGGTYTDAGATATDNVDGNITSRISTSTNLNTGTPGTYTFTYTVSDTAGNIASSSRTINVSSIIIPDTTAPVITINGANPVTVLAGSTYTDAGATALDNVDGDVTSRIVPTNPVNASSTAGTYSVVYTVSDLAGNIASSSRTVHVVSTPDITKPTISILGSNPVNVVVGTTYVDAGATATDNVDGVITSNIVTTGLPVNTSVVGTSSVVYTVTDGAGNVASSSRTVNIIPGLVDNVAPSIHIVGGTPVTVFVGATYTDQGATSTDNIDGDITSRIVTTGLPIDTSATGTFSVIYTVSDNAGNTSVATRTVDVIVAPIDNVAPVITITGGTPTTVLASSTYSDAGATATDNVDGVVPVITLSNNVDTNNLGVYAVVYQATDTAGNIAQATRTVNVVIATSTDNIPPVITLINGTPVTITVGSTYTDAGATALDNVDGDVTSGIASTSNVITSTPGTYHVIYTVSDTAGNIATATREVDVVPAGPDTIAPVISINGATPVTVLLNSTYTDAGATALDNVDGDITSKITKTGGVNTAATGTYSIIYSVSDTAGNAASTTRQVIVIASDTIAPIITINGANPMDIIKTLPYTELGATAMDNVDGSVSVTTTGSVNTAVVGSYIITYTAKDSSNNTATDTRVVNVINDNIAPVITLNGSSTVTINVGTNYVDAGAIATDNIDGNLTGSIIRTNPINASSTVGVYSVIYTVTDSSNNTTVAIRTVNIIVPDTVAPVLTVNGANPVNVTVGTTYTDAGATAIDNVDGDITARIVKTGFVNSTILGTYTVTYNVSDNAGNAAITANRTVNVVAASSNNGNGGAGAGAGGATNATPPTIVIIGQNPTTILVGSTYTDAGANAYDATDNTITQKIVVTNNVNTSVAGTYTVRYSVTDQHNNTSIATRVVNVSTVNGGTNTISTATTSTPVTPVTPLTVVTEPTQTTVTPITTGGEGTGVSSGSNTIPFIDLGNTLPAKASTTSSVGTSTNNASSSVAQATSTNRNGFLATVGLALGGMSKNILAILLSIIVLVIAGFMVYKVNKEE